MTLDRFGLCPHCGISWEYNDVFRHLANMDVFSDKTESELKDIARKNFAWSEDNPTNFSRVILHQIDEITLYQCPSSLCNHVFDVTGNKEYPDMVAYMLNLPSHVKF